MRFTGWRGMGSLLLVAILASGLLHGQPRLPAEPEKPRTRVDVLLHQLGDDDYAVREAANQELEALGEPVLPAVRRAAEVTDDPEIRVRAQQAVRRILLASCKSKSTGLQLVVIESGEFSMGTPDAEVGRRSDEKQHRAQIKWEFLVGAYEVTQDQYQLLMKRNPSWFSPTGLNKEKVKGLETGSFPVENVTWFDALEFCNRLSERDGFPAYYRLDEAKKTGESITSASIAVVGGNGYRLPTEAEWEYACRAGTSRRFHFGDTSTGRQANVKSYVAAGGYGGGGTTTVQLGRSSKVGSYPANAWGLHDMHGNVGEWCWDFYDKDFYARSAKEDPRGPEEGLHRVLRGGSWLVSDGSCRSGSRFWLTPGESKEHWGFRVARTP